MRTINKVLVRIEKVLEDTVKINGQDLYLDPTYNPLENTRYYGTVMQVPETKHDVSFYEKMHKNDRIQLKVSEIPNSLQVGDKVYFKYIATSNELAFTADSDTRKGYIDVLLDEYNIYCAVRDGRIIPVSGFCIIEPVAETVKTFLFVPPKNRLVPGYGRLLNAPEPFGFAPNLRPYIGYNVFYNRAASLQRDIEGNRVMPLESWFVLGYEHPETKEIVPVGDTVLVKTPKPKSKIAQKGVVYTFSEKRNVLNQRGEVLAVGDWSLGFEVSPGDDVVLNLFAQWKVREDEDFEYYLTSEESIMLLNEA